jgi:hypothetical protein
VCAETAGETGTTALLWTFTLADLAAGELAATVPSGCRSNVLIVSHSKVLTFFFCNVLYE